VIKREKEQKEDEEQSDDIVKPSIQQAFYEAKLLEKFLLFHEDDSNIPKDMEKIHSKIQKKYWQGKNLTAK